MSPIKGRIFHNNSNLKYLNRQCIFNDLNLKKKMSENKEIPEEDTKPEKATRPRREDGTFMSKDEITSMKSELAKAKEENLKYLEEANKALMVGTGLSNDHFKGMNPRQINQFLKNFHEQKKTEESIIQEKEPNSPILGTPIGSGRRKALIDDYLKIQIKDGRPDIDFDAPASIVFGKHKNKKEALNKWLEAN